MKKLIFVGLLAILVPVASAMAGGSERGKDFDRCDHGSWAVAGDSSPYVVGQWKLRDSFVDFTSIAPTILPGPPPISPIVTDNTEFDFQNPTNLALQLETAFYDEGGTFCGCDRRALKPNGTVRYTMLGEEQAKLLSRAFCPTQTDGMMKAIVFQKRGKHCCHGDEVLTGLQIHMNVTNSPQFRTETGLIKVRINQATLEEMKTIHEECLDFLGPVVEDGK